MKIYFAYQGKNNSILKELDVSESITAEEVLGFQEIKTILESLDYPIRIGVNGEELDGKFKPLPCNFRMAYGERLEIYKPLNQDPKERRKERAKKI